jgi:hypothetical protein
MLGNLARKAPRMAQSHGFSADSDIEVLHRRVFLNTVNCRYHAWGYSRMLYLVFTSSARGGKVEWRYGRQSSNQKLNTELTRKETVSTRRQSRLSCKLAKQNHHDAKIDAEARPTQLSPLPSFLSARRLFHVVYALVPREATMVNHHLAVAKATFAASLLRPDVTKVNRDEVPQFHALLEAATSQCSPSNVQVCSLYTWLYRRT